MEKLKYSDIVGAYFYNIKLRKCDVDMVDTHFTGAAHHLKRFHEALDEDNRRFHLLRHRLHMRLMMSIIHDHGNFINAVDPSGRRLNKRETWHPDNTTMVDQNMFRRMVPDWRFPVGVDHCSDHYLHKHDLSLNIDDLKYNIN
jgi:hypothetical protein